ncbi:MAG: hypothetical protein ACTSP1_13945 [Candidatus Freyarchaeota archaeon]
MKCGKGAFKAYVECRFKHLKEALLVRQKPLQPERLSNAFKLLSMLQPSQDPPDAGAHTPPFEAGDCKLEHHDHEVWSTPLRSKPQQVTHS